MTITGVITAIIIGAIIGGLARLILPGKQNIPIWLTIVVGIVAAVIGTFIARAVGIPTVTSGISNYSSNSSSPSSASPRSPVSTAVAASGTRTPDADPARGLLSEQPKQHMSSASSDLRDTANQPHRIEGVP